MDYSGSTQSNGLIRAAEYVRMSTEHQKYSTENQSAAIRRFAASKGMEIVRSYSDAGKSGLRIEGRKGLQQLLIDVDLRDIDFEVLLVYDVSRWGRFQDADEAAHYEYLCRQAGLKVHYCAEQFDNDGSPVSTIVKGVKRAMAGEYSRELSAKVFAGQCRLIEKGFRQGGVAGFGLRRMLVNEFGEQKGELRLGQKKSLQTDRVILVPGPEAEVRLVNRMYAMFVEDGISEGEIAETLNREGHVTDYGRSWTRGTVRQVLTNEKYVGNNVYNRTSFKLKKEFQRNAPADWVRLDGAFEAIVPLAMFHMARGIIRERARRLSDEEMLKRLKSVFEKFGYLSGLIIDEQEDLPSSGAYAHRFGSLLRAYEIIGYTPDRDFRYIEINRRLRALHPEIVSGVVEEIERRGAWCAVEPSTQLLTVSDEFTASVVIARHRYTQAGASRWKVHFDTGLRPDITIAVRMDADNVDTKDFFLLPRVEFQRDALNLQPNNHRALDAYKFADLSFLFELARRQPIERVI